MLRKVIVILKNETSKEELSVFRKMLEEEQIESLWYIAETIDANREETIMEEILSELEKKNHNFGTVFICDSPDICKQAIEGGCSCIAYLGGGHENFFGVRYAIESFASIDVRYLERVCRRYAGKPWDILQTKRCMVREMTVEDVDAFFEIYKEPSITAYMEGLYPTKQQEVEYIRQYIKNVYEFFEYGLWTVLDKQTGQIIGRAGISWREETEMAELGYVFAKSYQRQGYAFEVCSAILQYAYEELGIEQMAAYIIEENVASKSLCKKLKFHQSGRRFLQNKWYEEWLYTCKNICQNEKY